MTEAMAWSVFTWPLRKSEVRATADRANAAVDRLTRATRSRWSSEIRLAYKETEAKGSPYSSVASALEAIDPENTIVIANCRTEKRRLEARRDAGQTFDEAEKQLSTDLTREGSIKAIRRWELDLNLIHRADGISTYARLAG